MDKASEVRLRERLKAPRAAAFAGIAFSVLMLTSLVLTRLSVPVNPAESGRWLVTESRHVQFALDLLPFAGLAFLWFIGVLRDRLGEREDRFFGTVVFGSGLLFIALLFVAAAVANGVTMVDHVMPGKLAASGLYTYARTVAYQIMNVYAIKMAAAFMMSTCTLSLHAPMFPRWIAWLGYVIATALLLASTFIYWAPVLFPLWVMLVSATILRADAGQHRTTESTR
jgi:hypothetical protein